MTTWLGMKSIPIFGVNMLGDSDRLWAQDLSSLRSGEQVADSVVDKYVMLLSNWRYEHAFLEEDKTVVHPFCLPLKESRLIFDQYLKYGKLKTDKEKLKALQKAREAFADTFRTGPLSEWLLPAMVQRKASQGAQDDTDSAKDVMVLVSIEPSGFCSKTTQEYETQVQEAGSSVDAVPEMTIRIYETVRSSKFKPLSGNEKKQLALYVRGLLESFTSKMVVDVEVRVDLEPELPLDPVSVPNPMDHKLLSLLFLRNLYIGEKVYDEETKTDKWDNVLDFSRQVKDEDHLRAMVFSHFMTQETKRISVPEMAKWLVRGKFNPSFGMIANPSSYREVAEDFVLPKMDDKYPPENVDHAVLRKERDASLEGDDYFYLLSDTNPADEEA